MPKIEGISSETLFEDIGLHNFMNLFSVVCLNPAYTLDRLRNCSDILSAVREQHNVVRREGSLNALLSMMLDQANSRVA